MSLTLAPAVCLYAMRRYAYGALIETATLTVDRETRAAELFISEGDDYARSTVTRRYAAELLALWRRDARRTARRDAAQYLGHDDSDRPRVEMHRWAPRRYDDQAPELAADAA